ncbi:MAG: hypothetical protein ACK4K6_17940 [Pseudarthrobacter sp.]
MIAHGDLCAAETLLLCGLQAEAPTADLHYELGRLYHLMGRDQLALPHLSAAGAVGPAEACAEAPVRSLLLAAWICLTNDQLDRASGLLQEAMVRLTVPPDAELAADFAICQAREQSLRGDLDGSNQLARTLFNRPNLSPSQRGDAAWILWQNASGHGPDEAAQAWLTAARELAAEAWWPPQLRRLYPE